MTPSGESSGRTTRAMHLAAHFPGVNNTTVWADIGVDHGAEMAVFVRAEAADGFILVPRPTPGGLDEFVDRVVPLLQERGAFRTRYEGSALREHLGLPQLGAKSSAGNGT